MTLAVGQENNVRTLGSGVVKIGYANKKEGIHKKRTCRFLRGFMSERWRFMDVVPIFDHIC